MSFNVIGIFVDVQTAPAGLLEGLLEATQRLPDAKTITLSPADLAQMSKGLAVCDLFVTYHADTYAELQNTVLITRQKAGFASLYLNQPFLRERCTGFGTPGQHLRYAMGFPHGKAYLGEPDPTYQPPAFFPMRQHGAGEFPLILMPTNGAAILHGWESAEQWMVDVLHRAPPTTQPYRRVYHPSSPEALHGDKLEDLLPHASRVYTLQSAAAFKALAMGVPVQSHWDDHPIGAYYEYKWRHALVEDVRKDMFQRVAAHDVPATSHAVLQLMRATLAKSLHLAG